MKAEKQAAEKVEMGAIKSAARRPLSWGLPWDLISLVVPLIAAFPWLRLQALALWARPDRWFGAAVIGLVLLGAVVYYLVWGLRRIEEMAGASRREVSLTRSRFAVALLLVSVVGSLLAALWVAPWLGAVAALGSVCAWALGRFPRLPGSTILAWGAMLLFVLPLPGRWEEQFPSWMEQSAGELSGSLLDLVGVPNLQFGNSLEVRGLTFNFPTAGRGPFAFWGLAGLLAATLYLRRAPLLSAVISLAFLPLLGIFLYLNRFAALALLQEYWGVNAISGTSFLWLCLVCLGLVYLGWLVLDVAIRFLFDAAPPELPEFAPFYAGLNKLVCWPQESPFDLPEEYLGTLPEPVAEPRGNWYQSGWQKIAIFLALATGLYASVVSLAAFGQRDLATSDRDLVSRYSMAVLKEFPGRETLPEKVDQWQRTEFSSPLEEEKEPRPIPEKFDFRWTYVLGNRDLEFRLRFPFLGEPSPTSLFEREGWEVTELKVQRDSEGLETAWIELFLRNNSGGRAWVCFSSYDAVGRPYSEVTEVVELLPNRPSTLQTLKRMVGELPPRTMQLQLYCDAVDVKDKPELARLRRIYLNLRKKLLEDRDQRNWSLGD